MRRILLLFTMATVMGAMMATSGLSASAQSPCPPTGPSGGTATLLTPDEPRWAGFVCLDEEDQRFFCPSGFELWLFRDAGSSPPFVAECEELSSSRDGGGTGGSDGGGGAELTQNDEQQGEAGEYNLTVNVS
jgi:hypothetical protein